MSRIQKYSSPVKLDISDWDREIWDGEMYKRHHIEFEKIQKEIRSIRERCPAAVVARWYWLQSKGAGRLKLHLGHVEFFVNPDNYSRYDNMFTKFNNWLSMEENKLSVKIPTFGEVYRTSKKAKEIWSKEYQRIIDFSEPLPEPQRTFDEVTENALNNF